MTTSRIKAAARYLGAALLVVAAARAATVSSEALPSTAGAVLGFAAGLAHRSTWAPVLGAATGAAIACTLVGYPMAYGLGFGAVEGALLVLAKRLASPQQ